MSSLPTEAMKRYYRSILDLHSDSEWRAGIQHELDIIEGAERIRATLILDH